MMENRPINRREVLRSLAASGLASAVLAGSAPPVAVAREIDVGKVPAAVKAGADRLFKKAKWSAAHRSMSGGQPLFELEGEVAKGQHVSVEVTADGKVTGVERKIDVKDVPTAVSKAVTDRLPKFEAATAFEIYHGDDIQRLGRADLSYELEGKAAKGR